MALLYRLRNAFPSNSSYINHRLHYRCLSTILSPDSTNPLSAKQKSRAALSLLKVEENPERIIDICRAATLTPESHLDRIAFSVAISKLSESKHFDGIRLFLEELKSRPDLKNERFACHAIILYGQANMLDHAIRTFKQIDELGVRPSVKSLNALLFACNVAKDYKELKRVFMEFPKIYGIEPDLDTYNRVIKAFSKSGSASAVYSIVAEMDRKGVKPNATTFANWLAGCYKEEKYEDVEKVINLMGKYGVRRGVSTYNARILSLCKLKKSSEAKALFDGMLSRGMKPNSVTYCKLIHGFCREGNLDEAKNLFKRMINSGCQPDSDCYFTLVYFHCRGGDYDTAFKICGESMEKGWVPNITTMKSLVYGLVSISKVDEAKQLIGQIKERFSKNVEKWNEIEAGLPQ
ncbi:pentatricopeptide repeat-containing protein At1g61870, mitochondrial-like [Cucurbita pepo subsp. pepo]|uniref:pentatricopeptide repeat-containing protein At1g61870, mitochondrial-like n=1 Tax=Cucurbita pepo subsp. pepo TaxID=3664 RepID=UPI000C9D97DA|nr:pentatricopeptide repeat-containing protein At1g61870, mitochondrial-like [Cucurbita pepo subsp. pepo]XP_023519003.1 pentatricopeptide repeat-containing protein At1g61870, mitochondrial-like [Cucurbita pepo subsp. pepo]